MYHISTCRQVVSYDGMWHYIARNFSKPTVIVSPEAISKYHTPNAIVASPFREKENSIFWWADNLPDMLGHSKRKANHYLKKCEKYFLWGYDCLIPRKQFQQFYLSLLTAL